MNTNTSPQDLKQEVLEKIQSGEVSMKSRRYFMLKVIYTVALTVLTAISLFILVSFLLFSLRVSGQFFLLGFGFRGLEAFVLLFPWWAFLVTAILLFVLERILVTFRFAYHSPFIYLFLSSVLAVAVVSYIINATSFHGSLLDRAHKKNLPVVGGYYQNSSAVRHDRGLFRGVIVSIGDNFIVIDDDDDIRGMPDLIRIQVPDNMSMVGLFDIGDRVYIGGDIASGSVRAYGIRKIIPSPTGQMK